MTDWEDFFTCLFLFIVAIVFFFSSISD